MSVRSASPELTGPLGVAQQGAPHRRVLPAALRASRAGRLALVAVTLPATWLVVTVLHELLVLGVSALLPFLAGLPLVESLVAALPMNYVYASAMVRYAGQIAPLGMALSGPVGVAAHTLAPAFFFDPTFVAGGGLASAVLGPGSSLLARALAVGLVDLALLAGALWLAAAAARRGGGAPALVDLPTRAAVWTAVAVAAQAEVAARLLRTAGSTRDLESLGVLPFIFHQLLRLHTDVYDRWTFHLSRLLDPVFSPVLLLITYGLIASGCGLYVVARGVGSGAVLAWLRRPAAARGWREEPTAPRAVRSARLVLDGALLAVLIAALPVVDGFVSEPRFLEWEVGQASVAVDGSDAPGAAVPVEGALAAASSAAIDGAASAAAGIVPEPGAPAAQPGPRRPSLVEIGGRGLRFTYVVDGQPTELRGMGYNVTHAGLPPAERAARLRRDFALMRDVGVNTLVGWRTHDWDEVVLDAAHEAGIGVVMPFDLDDKLDYSDREVRSRLRAEILAWVARYREHPAIRMWGIGNETLLHMKQSSRARAFADFYVGVVGLVRQFDPDHPVMYREAEDVYVRWLQEAWGATGGPPHGFVLGMNFYTFRMKDAIADWPKKNLDVPLVISEFAPAGFGRADRPAGFWRMWAIIRARPELVLGAAPYVWSVDGPEPADRLFGLTDGAGQPVDAALSTLKELYRSSGRGPSEAGTVDVPALTGLRRSQAEQVLGGLGLKVAAVEYRPRQAMREPQLYDRYGAGHVLQQEPAAGTQLPRGGAVRLTVAEAPAAPGWPKSRPLAS